MRDIDILIYKNHMGILATTYISGDKILMANIAFWPKKVKNMFCSPSPQLNN